MFVGDFNIKKRVNLWLSDLFDEETRVAVKRLLKASGSELADCFYKDLEFGTGGMRGVMGVGTNRINKYTLGKSTQGISNYLKKKHTGNIRVVIAYDCRTNSKELAQSVANIFSANEIETYLFSDLRPTPELSFAVRDLNCQCGVVLTASHNPPEYNGYKVYWDDGGQIVPPQDREIIKEIANVSFEELSFISNPNYIKALDDSIDEKYIDTVVKTTNMEAKNRKGVKIVFTALHGTSITVMPMVFQKAGFERVHFVLSQRDPDGYFPTVSSPNPEEPQALKQAILEAEELDADVVLGTDPDSDRVGVAVRNKTNKFEVLNGNQVMVVLVTYLLKKLKQKNVLSKKSYICSTIVSTPMITKIAKAFGITYISCLTGFKWIADVIKKNPKKTFLFGGEESLGYLLGDNIRDKDAVMTSLFISEIIADVKHKGLSFYDLLITSYKQYGFYKERLISLTKKGLEGTIAINNIMYRYRSKSKFSIDGESVSIVEDYLESKRVSIKDNFVEMITLPKSDVLIFETDVGTRIALRPSGTEPKIKCYISVNTTLESEKAYESTEVILENKINRIVKELNLV